jgi:hypothetical protein
MCRTNGTHMEQWSMYRNASPMLLTVAGDKVNKAVHIRSQRPYNIHVYNIHVYIILASTPVYQVVSYVQVSVWTCVCAEDKEWLLGSAQTWKPSTISMLNAWYLVLCSQQMLNSKYKLKQILLPSLGGHNKWNVAFHQCNRKEHVRALDL